MPAKGQFKYNPGDKVGPNQILMIKRTKFLNKKHWYGIFQCPFCNKFFETRIDNISRGRKKHCGCQPWSSPIKIKKGDRFHSLTVIESTNKKRGNHIVWKCQCDCGRFTEVLGSDLRSNSVHSCGECLKDLTGQRSGLLIAIEPTNKRAGTNIIWKCQCDCGNITYVDSYSFKTNKKISCGCLSMSIGELKIREILNKIKINYKQEYYIKKTRQRFDFYLFDYNCAIEFDGAQHFEEWTLGDTTLKERQEKDQIKNQYCKDNNIYLLRIPYTDYNILDEEYIMERLNNLNKYDYNNQNSS